MDMNSASQRIIADLLYARTGQTLSHDRLWRIPGALANVFRANGVSNIDQLVCLLASPGNEQLATDTIEALLNNETYFCRDRTMLSTIETHVLPALHEARWAERKLRIWSAGCSTGQEPLTLSMMLEEQGSKWDGWDIEIHASDISQSAITTARAGVYSQFEIQRGLSVGQMLRHFDETEHGWVAHRSLCDKVEFRTDNLLKSRLPAERYDLVLCRNVLLYFDDIGRANALSRIRSTLRPDGWLMLGAGETVIGHEDSWAATGLNSGLYCLQNLRTSTIDRGYAVGA